jgi:hypothetical protein
MAVRDAMRRRTYVLDAVTGAWVLNATDGQPTNAMGGGPMTTTDHAKKEVNQ